MDVLTNQVSSGDESERATRLAFLADASTTLAASMDPEEALLNLAGLTVQFLADLCLIDVLEQDGSIRRVAAVHTDPDRQPLADRLKHEFAPDPRGPHPAVGVMRTGRSDLSPQMPDDFLRRTSRNEEHYGIIKELGFQSYMCVPLLARRGIVGAFTLVSTDPERVYGPLELDLAENLARRAVLAVDNARLYEAERHARAEAEAARERLAFLAGVGQALAASLDYDAVMERVARLAVPTLADLCVIDALQEDGTLRRVAAAHPEEGMGELARTLRRHPPEQQSGHPAIQAMRTGRSKFVSRVSPAMTRRIAGDPETLRVLEGFRPTSMMVVPLVARGRVLGAISLIGLTTSRDVGKDDLQVAQELARRAAFALDNARLYHHQQHIAQTLQRSLLPAALPHIPGLDLAARYQAAGEGTEVGGDFYDLFQTSDGAWTVVMGDVCGRGPEAAAVTGLARFSLRAVALHAGTPSGALALLNESLLEQVEPARFCTVACARIEAGPDGLRLTVSCAGHPQPILMRADGTIEHAGRVGTLLGVFDDPELTDQVTDLRPGDTMLLYTDGVIETRRQGEVFGEQRLAELLAGCAGSDAETIAGRIERAVVEFESTALKDDLALLVLRVLPGDR